VQCISCNVLSIFDTSSVGSALFTITIPLRGDIWPQHKHQGQPYPLGNNKTNVLCVKSILAGSRAPKSLIHGNGIVATHSPTMAATSTLVQNGRRRIYDRIRAGLIWGIEVIGMVRASTPGVWYSCYAGALCCYTERTKITMGLGSRVGASSDPPAGVDLAPSQTDYVECWAEGEDTTRFSLSVLLHDMRLRCQNGSSV
jgi:hypothetical protein